MSADADAGDGGFATVGPDPTDREPYRTITLEDGDVILYSADEADGEAAWIQSDDYVDLSLMV